MEKIKFEARANRLKTLEDKVKFIMGRAEGMLLPVVSLQDLWDEGDEDKGWSCGKCKQEALGLTNKLIPEHHRTCRNRIKPTVKECDCERGGDFCSCSITELYNDGEIRLTKRSVNNSEKIEEIIKDLRRHFIFSGRESFVIVNVEDIESWLRDKLK